jgi:general secretion pathway protein G
MKTASNHLTKRFVGHIVKDSARAGFSLLELMLVLAIISILVAAAAYNLAGAGARAKNQITKSSLNTIKGALSSYNIQYSSYPVGLPVLITTRFLEDKRLQDAWGREWLYDPRGLNKDQPYILGSAGEDGIPGNEDDINVWTMDK